MSDDLDPQAFREAFLSANANAEFIASELADVIRAAMRSVTSDDSSGGVHAAAEKMDFVNNLIVRSGEKLSWYGLFHAAIEEIKGNIPDDPEDRRYIDAAKRGTKYLVECSATDNAARGRASRRLQEFRDAIRWSVEARRGQI